MSKQTCAKAYENCNEFSLVLQINKEVLCQAQYFMSSCAANVGEKLYLCHYFELRRIERPLFMQRELYSAHDEA